MTKVVGVSSSEHSISYGVPQGSILGSLLFLVFINNLCNSIELCGTSMYTDDIVIFYLSEDEDDLQISLQYDLQTVAFWMNGNRLSLNTSKGKKVHLKSKWGDD